MIHTQSRLAFVSIAIATVSALSLSGCTAAVQTPQQNQPLQQAVRDVFEDARFANGAWSVLAVDLGSGESVYELNPTAPLVPGSIMKTFTNGTALSVLGPDSTVTTRLEALGEIEAGVLRGSLALVGAGDFSFGLREQEGGTLAITGFDHNEANTGILPAELVAGDPLSGLRALVTQVREAGITQIDGELIIDNRLFTAETDWPDGRIDSIWINENLFDAILTPGDPGEPPVVELRPDLKSITIENEALTVTGSDVNISVEDLGAGRVSISGEIGSEAGEVVRVAQIEDPVEFARIALHELLTDAGITVTGTASVNAAHLLPESYPGAPLATWESASTAERVKVVQKISYNRGADLFGCLIAVGRGSTDCEAGLGVILDTIESHGTPPGSAFVFDPAGSNDYNRISAAGQVDFLIDAATNASWGEALVNAMPVSGVDGSLATFGEGTAAAGKVQAKTGTRIVGYPARDQFFYAAQAYSGYMTTESGRDLAFTVIFNATTASSMEEILDVVAGVGTIVLALQQHC